MMDEQQVLRIFNKVGAVINNTHVVCMSGKHSNTYINKDAIYPHTAETSKLCRAIAERFTDDNVEVVIAPAIGGVILSQWTAHHLSEMSGREVLATYAEKEGMKLVSSSYGPLPPKYEDKFIIKRGYDKIVAGKRVLVVEDILTTGGSARKVIQAARNIGGNIIGLGVLWNRGGITAQDVGGVPKLTALVNMKLEEYEMPCPLCKKGVKVNTYIGKGREFLERKKT